MTLWKWRAVAARAEEGWEAGGVGGALGEGVGGRARGDAVLQLRTLPPVGDGPLGLCLTAARESAVGF